MRPVPIAGSSRADSSTTDPGTVLARELLDIAGEDWNLLVQPSYGFATRTGIYVAMLLPYCWHVGSALWMALSCGQGDERMLVGNHPASITETN
jgi:hypothetical protein